MSKQKNKTTQQQNEQIQKAPQQAESVQQTADNELSMVESLGFMQDASMPLAQRQQMLQRMAPVMGNQTIQRMLADGTIQRQQQLAQAGPPTPLSDEERNYLHAFIQQGIGFAADSFDSATGTIADEVKAEIAKNDAMKQQMVWIVFGFLSPALGVGMKNLSTWLPGQRNENIFRMARSLTDAVGDGQMASVPIAGTLDAATRLVRDPMLNAVKGDFSSYQGFFTTLRDQNRAHLQLLAAELANASDTELTQAGLFWDYNNHTESMYAAKIREITENFKWQVMEQGTHTFYGGASAESRVYGLQYGNGRPVGVLVSEHTGPYGGEIGKFITDWLTPDVGVAAVEKTVEEQGHVKVVGPRDIPEAQSIRGGGPSFRLPQGTPTWDLT